MQTSNTGSRNFKADVHQGEQTRSDKEEKEGRSTNSHRDHITRWMKQVYQFSPKYKLMNKEDIEAFALNFVISGSAAAVMKTIVAPLDRIKLILQNQNSSYQVLTGKLETYKGFMDVLRRLPKEQGYLSYWRGNGVNLMRYIPSQALNFCFYDLYKDHLHRIIKAKRRNKAFESFLAGGLAGCTSTVIIYPLEFCQTKIATDMGADKTFLAEGNRNQRSKREFSGLRDCMHSVYNVAGIKGYYRGLNVQLVGITVYRSCYFGMYDTAKEIFTKTSSKEPIQNSLFLAVMIAQVVTIIAGLAAYPFDTVGRRLMLDSGRSPELRLFKNTFHVVRTLYTHTGIVGFYRGAFMNCLRGMGSAMVLVIYDIVNYYTNWKGKLKKS